MTTQRYVRMGIVGGLLGGLLMSMTEMTSELVSGHSFFTPLYHIAAPLVGMAPMETAMKSPGLGYFDPVPALIGMIVHFAWSATWGLLFGLIASGARLVGAAAVAWSWVYVVAVAFVMSYLVLPLAGLRPIPEMPGWLPFVLMHAAYALGLSLWVGRTLANVSPIEVERRHTRAA
jgi:hypothetical protein